MRFSRFDRRSMLWGLAVLAVLGPLATVLLGFGDEGHRGILLKTLELLRANDPDFCATHWPASWEPQLRDDSVVYPDCAVQYYDTDILPKNMEHLQGTLDWVREKMEMANALNSAEHYFDPRPDRTHVVFGLLVQGESCVKLGEPGLGPDAEQRFKLAAIIGLGYFQLENGWKCDIGGAPKWGITIGADGYGYNAVTATLFGLNGRHWPDNTNPAGVLPSKGFIPLALECNPTNKNDSRFVEALECLGCSVHYIEDLFSPGHTEWTSWCQSKKLGFPEPGHEDFDYLGDSYFTDATERRGYFYHAETLKGQRAALEDYLNTRACPRCILSFERSSAPCKCTGGVNVSLSSRDWSSDLLAVLLQEAESSRELWDGRAETSKSDMAVKFTSRMESAVEVVAGVVDWAFSRAASADAPYSRDAPNFYSMAAGAALSDAPGALLSVQSLDGARGSLGGIDQDDYFAVAGTLPRSVVVDVDEADKSIELGVMTLTSPDARPMLLAPKIEKTTTASDRRVQCDLGPAATQLERVLIRVYSTQADRLHYTIRLVDQPGPQPPLVGASPLVYLAILLIGFSFILRPALGRSANGLILIAFAMIGISLLFDILRAGSFTCVSLLVIMVLVILLGRGGLRQLQGRR